MGENTIPLSDNILDSKMYKQWDKNAKIKKKKNKQKTLTLTPRNMYRSQYTCRRYATSLGIKQTQIRATVKHQVTPLEWLKFNRWIVAGAHEMGAAGTLAHCWRSARWCHHLGKQASGFSNNRIIATCVAKRNESTCPCKGSFTNIHSRLWHNSQTLNTTQASFNRWKQKTVCPHDTYSSTI